MKVFALVLVVATVIGGFVGGELSERTFSLLGAVIGCVGTGVVLLSLGAYFHAQEEKRKKQQDLPPEMRAVFDRMFGSPAGASAAVTAATATYWRPRPFHANTSRAEFAEWFANAPGWKELDPRLIQVLIKRLHGNQMFEVFVHASQDCNLVRQYKPLSDLFDRGVGDVAAVPRIAQILDNAGVANGKRFAEFVLARKTKDPEIDRVYMNALNSFEAAVHVEPQFLHGYLHLAELKKLLGKDREAIAYCEQGLEQLRRMKTRPAPDRFSAGLDEVGAALSSLRQKLRAT